ncbi:reverse transcriptase domain-containing protein [Tanacetum coccineum]
MSTIIQGIASSCINGYISPTSSISKTKTSVVERKQDIPDKGAEANSELFLDQLGLDLTGTLIVMLGRMWDVSAVTGRYLSTDFIVSDAKDSDGIESLDNKYLIDVFGYMTNVGRTNHLKSSSKNLDFHLANHRVTLWGSLGDVLIEKKTKQTSVCPVILTATCPKKYNNKVYLSSTSSTVIYDDDAIHAIKALKKANRSPLMESGQGRDGTSLYVGATPIRRYRLEVDVSDDTAQAVVVMFNETATALVNYSADSLMDTVDESLEDHLSLPPALSNLIGTAHVMEIKSHTYYEYMTLESFKCWRILPSEGIEDNVGFGNLDDYPDNQPQKLKRIVRDPSIVTPSKLMEERKKPRMDVKNSESKDSSDSVNGTGKKGAVEPFTKKRKNRCHDFRIVYDQTDLA